MTYLDQATKNGKYFVRDDPLSLPKAILYGVTKAIPGTESAINNRMNKFRAAKQKWNEKAEKLLTDMGMEPKEKYTERDLKKLSTHFTDHYFTLFTRERGEKMYKPCYSTGDEGIRIDLMLFKGSYEWFKSTQKNIGYTTCQFCREMYKKQVTHACKKCCPKCRYPLKECSRAQRGYDKVCGTCNRMFYTQVCFENHQRKYKKRAPACEVFRKCTECDKQYNTRNAEHQCGFRYCDNCWSHQPISHPCCWTPPTAKTIERLRQKEKEFKLVIFDCEAIQTRTIEDVESYLPKHYVCYLYWSLLCHECIQTENSFNADCSNCGPEKKGHFRHQLGEAEDKVIRDFITMICLKRTDLNNSIVIAHNAGRYDHHFLIPVMLEMNIIPTVIKRGNQIIQMIVKTSPDYSGNNLKFRDSFLFINMSLSKMPTAFGYPGAKTWFPYTYCTPEVYGVKLKKLSDRKYYGVKNMSPSDYIDFNKWWREHKDDPWSFDDVLHLYGANDVEVLHRGIEGYINNSVAISSWNPLVQSVTFAAFSFFLIKHEHIKPGMVGILPENGYFAGQNASKLANKYMSWLEHTRGIKLQTKLNGGEKQFVLESGKVARVDGWDNETGTAYEFCGSFWHGDDRVYKDSTMNPVLKRPMGDLFRETQNRFKQLRKQCKLEVAWELDINKELASNPAMKHFFSLVAHTSRLIAQDALAGVKTPLPVGQPKVITENFEPIYSTFPLPYKGLYKIDILPPKNLLHPVVWMRIRGRLIFSLCRTCAIKEQKAKCEHSDQERMIHTTLFHGELRLAQDMGYVVCRTYEVWHWDRWQTDLYRDFLGGYIKSKIEKSGFPRKDMSESEISAWITDMAEKNEGIMIDRENVEENIPQRTIAKMAINSAWAKFIEKSVKTEVAFFKTDAIPPAIFDSDHHEITDIIKMTDTIDMVSYEIKEEFARQKAFSNTVFGAITTAAGRIELYKVLRRLGSRVLYTDTDSVIFYADEVQDRLLEIEAEFPIVPYLITVPSLGDHLGGWKSELKPSEEILEYCAIAPKVYSYKKCADGRVSEITKARGVTLDKAATHELNFDSLHQLAKDYAMGKVNSITTKKPVLFKFKLGSITTRIMEKTTKPVLDKMLVDKNFRSKPYGWTDSSFVPIDLDEQDSTLDDVTVQEPGTSGLKRTYPWFV